ncbi:MAG: Gfo/Idh/MocA family oxidoreductase, partial [Phycisphaerae bacterium]|nr:Gfo/Idh/MocA family oxidoreductase [Phycisphaerae bacterium]
MVTRRAFIKSTAAVVGVPYVVPSTVLGVDGAVAPSEKITVGFIGTGDHGVGRNLRMYLGQPDARAVAVCDVDGSRMKGAKQLVDEKYGNADCAMTKDFREILDRKDIDAVMISTPDHWHVLMSVMAIKAGKDVQCEKPTLTIEEGKFLVKTVRRYGKVFQTSTEDRSERIYHRMAELVRNSRIGKLHTIKVKLPQQPNTAGDPTPKPVPPELDWDMWLGPAPYGPYCPDRVHFNFRWVWDTSGGILCDWGTHLFDTAQWANDTERTGPVSVEGKGTWWSGGLYNTPKDYHVEYTYANGVKMICDQGGSGIRFEGSDGWIESPSWLAEIQASDPKILESKIGPNEIRLYTNPAGEHRDFLDCIKTRKDP